MWDPIYVLARSRHLVLLFVSVLELCMPRLGNNLAANIVATANDFSEVAPRKISFRTGGLITGIIGVLIMPWKLVADPSGYIFTWLIGYSALLGPIGGIMIADYFFVRRRQLNVGALYDEAGEYRYTNGISLVAVVAFLLAVLPNLPGFLVTIKAIAPTSVPGPLVELYNYAWFVGFALAFVIYLVLRKIAPNS